MELRCAATIMRYLLGLELKIYKGLLMFDCFFSCIVELHSELYVISIHSIIQLAELK